jgi:hypothetical protein
VAAAAYNQGCSEMDSGLVDRTVSCRTVGTWGSARNGDSRFADCVESSRDVGPHKSARQGGDGLVARSVCPVDRRVREEPSVNG